MANLTENTTYGSTGNQPNFSEATELVKKLQNKTPIAVPVAPVTATATAPTTPTSVTPPAPTNTSDLPDWNEAADLVSKLQTGQPSSASGVTPSAYQSPLMPHYTAQSFANIFGVPETSFQPKTAQDTVNMPINEPFVANNPNVKNEPLTSDYTQIAPADAKGRWVSPSSSATFRDLPPGMGGGQYIVDPTQPGKMIKSTRSIMDYHINPGAEQKLLGKLSPKLYQVDHIVPLWIGGADSLKNLEILDNPTHEAKTAIQAVPLTLLANGLITLDQAKLMALTWKDKTDSSSDIPAPDKSGYIPVDKAQQIAQQWQDDLTKPVGFFDKRTWKNFGSSFKETMGNFGKGWLPDPIREFGKGLVGGGTAGIVPGTEASPESGGVGIASNIAGNVVGTITGMGLLSKGLGIAGLGVKTLFGLNKAAALTEDALKAANLVTDIGNASEKGISALDKTSKWGKAAQSAGILTAWGQLGLTGRELTGQEEASLSNHLKQAATDIAYGGILGTAGQNVKGYARVAIGSTALALMTGQDIVPALQNGILMSALHGMGYEKGLMDPKTTIGENEAYKMAATTMNQYTHGIFPDVKVGGTVPDVLKFDSPTLSRINNLRTEYQTKYPSDTRFANIPPITNESDAIDFLGQVAKKEAGSLVTGDKGIPSEEEIEKEIQRVTVATNQLKNRTLLPEVREQKELKDIYSLGEKLRPQIKGSTLKPAMNSTEVLSKLNTQMVNKNSIPSDTVEKYQNETFPEGLSTTRGIGRNENGVTLDPEARTNLNDFATHKRMNDGKIYFPINEKSRRIGIFINNESIANGQKPPLSNPDDTLRGFMKDAHTGEYLPVGYFTQPEGISETNKFNINKPYADMADRFKSIWEKFPNATTLMNNLNKDRAFRDVPITEEKANSLMMMKGKLSTMNREDIIQALEPSNGLSKYTIDNSMVTPKMKDLGLDTLIVDINKLSPIGQGTNINDPSVEFGVTKADFLRSLDMQEKSPVVHNTAKMDTTDMSKAISNLTTKTNVPMMPTEASTVPVEAQTKPVTPITPIAPVPPVETPISSKYQNVAKGIIEKPLETATKEFYNDLIDRIEYAKPDIGSAKSHEQSLMDIVNAFKRKNPGLSDKDFKTAINTAKSRATAYVQDYIDSTYKGSEIFGTSDKYSRELKPEREIRKDDSQVLADKFGLQMTEPNENGKSFLKLDKAGKPSFTEEFKKSNKITNQTPNDVWGSFLEDELKVYKSKLSTASKEWGSGIEQMRNSKSPYAQGFAKVLDNALQEKFGDEKHSWKGSWKLNPILKNAKDLFNLYNEEGYANSQPFRRTAAITAGKNYTDIAKAVAKADIKTKGISEQALADRQENLLSGAKPLTLPEGMRVKDPSQIQNISEDLTPMDMVMNGLLNSEVRKQLISRYDTLRSELGGSSSASEPNKITELKTLFAQIKKVSANSPEEVKTWKLGNKIILKNGGEPTLEEGMKDASRLASKIFGYKKTPGFIDFEKIKQKVRDGKGGPVKGDNNKAMGKITHIARHGSTNSNGDKVFRGWVEKPENQLTDKGKEDAKKLGEEVKKIVKDHPEEYIICSSDLNRAVHTAKIVSDISKVPLGNKYHELRSQDTGDFTGRKETEVKHHITHNIENEPHNPLPGASESHNDFLRRIKEIFKHNGKIASDHDKKKIIVITHHQVEVLHANDFAPADDFMFSKGIPPGGVREVNDKNDGQGGPYKEGDGPMSYLSNFLKGPFGSRAVEIKATDVQPLIPAPVKPTPPMNVPQLLKGIATNETSVVPGNKYKSSQFSGLPNLGRALGKYRVTEGELKSYGQRYLGRSVTPKEFQNSPELQDTYMTNKAKHLNEQGYSPSEIADIHNQGMTHSFPAGSGKYQNPDYVNKFNSVYNATTSSPLTLNR